MLTHPAPAGCCPSARLFPQPLAKGTHHPTTGQRPTHSGWWPLGRSGGVLRSDKEEVSGETGERHHRPGSWAPRKGLPSCSPGQHCHSLTLPGVGVHLSVTPQHSHQFCLSTAVGRAQTLEIHPAPTPRSSVSAPAPPPAAGVQTFGDPVGSGRSGTNR